MDIKIFFLVLLPFVKNINTRKEALATLFQLLRKNPDCYELWHQNYKEYLIESNNLLLFIASLYPKMVKNDNKNKLDSDKLLSLVESFKETNDKLLDDDREISSSGKKGKKAKKKHQLSQVDKENIVLINAACNYVENVIAPRTNYGNIVGVCSFFWVLFVICVVLVFLMIAYFQDGIESFLRNNAK